MLAVPEKFRQSRGNEPASEWQEMESQYGFYFFNWKTGEVSFDDPNHNFGGPGNGPESPHNKPIADTYIDGATFAEQRASEKLLDEIDPETGKLASQALRAEISMKELNITLEEAKKNEEASIEEQRVKKENDALIKNMMHAGQDMEQFRSGGTIKSVEKSAKRGSVVGDAAKMFFSVRRASVSDLPPDMNGDTATPFNLQNVQGDIISQLTKSNAIRRSSVALIPKVTESLTTKNRALRRRSSACPEPVRKEIEGLQSQMSLFATKALEERIELSRKQKLAEEKKQLQLEKFLEEQKAKEEAANSSRPGTASTFSQGTRARSSRSKSSKTEKNDKKDKERRSLRTKIQDSNDGTRPTTPDDNTSLGGSTVKSRKTHDRHWNLEVALPPAPPSDDGCSDGGIRTPDSAYWEVERKPENKVQDYNKKLEQEKRGPRSQRSEKHRKKSSTADEGGGLLDQVDQILMHPRGQGLNWQPEYNVQLSDGSKHSVVWKNLYGEIVINNRPGFFRNCFSHL